MSHSREKRIGTRAGTVGAGALFAAVALSAPANAVIDVSDDPAHPISQYLLRNDLALLRLDAPVDETPIDIAAESAAPGTPVRAMGWGMVDEFGEEEKPTVLRQLDTGITDHDRCAEADQDGGLCSEHPTEEAQLCTADSGGPAGRDGDFDVDPSCVGPMVLTDPVAHGDWITETISGGTRLQ